MGCFSGRSGPLENSGFLHHHLLLELRLRSKRMPKTNSDPAYLSPRKSIFIIYLLKGSQEGIGKSKLGGRNRSFEVFGEQGDGEESTSATSNQGKEWPAYQDKSPITLLGISRCFHHVFPLWNWNKTSPKAFEPLDCPPCQWCFGHVQNSHKGIRDPHPRMQHHPCAVPIVESMIKNIFYAAALSFFFCLTNCLGSALSVQSASG